MTHISRIVEHEIAELHGSLAAVAIEGGKGRWENRNSNM